MTKEEQIMAIAEEEFIQNGYLSTSMVTVAKRAGLTHAVSSKVDFHQSGTEKGTREEDKSKVSKFGFHYKFLSSF